MNSKYLGQRLRQFRKDARLTQNQLAKKAGITPTYLSIIERGAQLPRLETFINLANILSVSADDLLMDVDENTDLARQFHVMSIPTCVFLKDGSEVERFVGSRDKQEYIDTLKNL